MAAIGVDYAAGDLDDISWRSAREGLTGRLEDARRRLSEAEPSRVVWVGRGAELRVKWAAMSAEERRYVVRSVVARIEIGPAVKGRNFFDPGRVRIEWR